MLPRTGNNEPLSKSIESPDLVIVVLERILRLLHVREGNRQGSADRKLLIQRDHDEGRKKLGRSCYIHAQDPTSRPSYSLWASVYSQIPAILSIATRIIFTKQRHL